MVKIIAELAGMVQAASQNALDAPLASEWHHPVVRDTALKYFLKISYNAFAEKILYPKNF